MDYRRLGASGFTVPALSFGTGTFAGKGEFFQAWGSTDVAEARRLIDICLDAGLNMFDTADIYSAGGAEEVLGRRHQGPGAGLAHHLDQGDVSVRRCAEPGGLVALPPRRHGRQAVEAARHRLHRPVPAARFRRPDAGRGGALDARPARARRQGPLHGRIELLRLARHEVARGGGPARLSALRGEPDLLLSGRPRLRVGADAARARPGPRRRGVEPSRLGPVDRQDPPRPGRCPSGAGSTRPPTPDRRSTTSTSTRSSTPSMPWRRRPARPCRRSR